ncbi:MAG TPA: helix-turn-helix transcriptional regulator [Burkholderiaceae bacterium]|nr:helix-turn-helix transcriptional regulator [Burkholderiaceae bacterium]
MHHDPLLLDLYACPAHPSRWSQVLDRLCHETGALSAVMQAFRFEGDGVRLQWLATDRHTAGQHAHPQGQLSDIENPRMDRRRTLRGLNRVVRDDELFDRDDPARVALQRRLAHLGYGSFMGLLQLLEGDLYLGIALHRAAGDRHDFDIATSNRLALLAPHLRQACELGTRLRQGERRIASLQAHLDGLRCGLLLCDGKAGVQWMNRSARTLTSAGLSLRVHGTQLRAHCPAASAALHEEIAQAGVQTRFLSLGQGDDALHLALRTQAGDEALVLLAVTRAGDAAAVPQNAWSRLLGVTSAEAALVATLVAGGTLEQHAEHRGISPGTVRGQFKQVLAKTGTHRQAELVRLALSSAAAHVLDSVPTVQG